MPPNYPMTNITHASHSWGNKATGMNVLQADRRSSHVMECSYISWSGWCQCQPVAFASEVNARPDGHSAELHSPN